MKIRSLACPSCAGDISPVASPFGARGERNESGRQRVHDFVLVVPVLGVSGGAAAAIGGQR